MLTLPVAFKLYNRVTFDWQKQSLEGWTDVSNDDFDSTKASEMDDSFINIINNNPEKLTLPSFGPGKRKHYFSYFFFLTKICYN
jgi:hypothetical protein